ncbi:FUSC family protein [Micromonospora thermarum]|uniref:Integral membrane bound transporter domain-containing protein n=1 Tax=Micromonospora thermarum TaxID=2720024 RepID=A0ABX0Z968_9ACTN|nr:FUSC family protein [Micromonospora thermarum]NJP34420.1 hypothetical protein [Micromonospora thermarum]
MIRWGWARTAAGRLRHGWRPVVEATLAATVAWFLAADLVGDPQPFFAPAAALIVLGQARGQRIRRAVEVVLGVTAGVLVADLVLQALGPRTTGTVFTVILLTVALAVTVGATGVTLVQAAVSALYLVAVPPPGDSLVPFRFVDALIGGAVAIVVSQFVGARRPLARLAGEVRDTFDALAALVTEVADALDRRDSGAALAVLERARGMDAAVDRLRDEVRAAGEALRLHVRRRRHLGRLESVDAALHQIDYVVRNVRVLARAGVTLSRLPTPPPAAVGDVLRRLAGAVQAAGAALAADLDGAGVEADRHAERAEQEALAAVRSAGRLYTPGGTLPLAMIVGQVRATAIDLLRGVGADDDAAVLTRVDEALGLPGR